MCGIAGMVDPDWGHDERGLGEIARRMADRLSHRGPDDAGTWADAAAGTALAHRRLSILDVSSLGHQPMTSACGRIVLTYNGEIYNFAELRRELERTGIRFRGRSDSEVLVEAIARWGPRATLERINGMFAFGAWDRDARRLTLARDRYGEKPLYYGRLGGTVVFASELKALRAHPGWRGGIDRDALVDLLRFGSVPAPRSIHPGIAKLPPATYLELDPSRAGPLPAPVTYWRLDEIARRGAADPLREGDAASLERLRQTLEEAVRSRMVSDVPIGALLSGGVDSALVVALMQRVATGSVKTFTIGFPDPDYDESGAAAGIAAAIGTDHTELIVDAETARAVIPELSGIYDEPFGDSSQIPSLLVARLARGHVTVALTGDGGDELFGGYYRHFWAPRFWRGARRLPGPLRSAAGVAMRATPRGAWDALARAVVRAHPRIGAVPSLADKAQKLGALVAARSLDDLYWRMISHWPEPERVVLGGPGDDTPSRRSRLQPFPGESAERLMLLDAQGYLPDDILTKVDRATMAVGLESRAPLLDHRVADLAWRLPADLRIRDGDGKWALRELVRELVPGETGRRPKSGFRVPIGDWLRGPLRDWAGDLLDPVRLRREGLLDHREVSRVWRSHDRGRRNHANQLWDVLMFEAWLDSQRNGRSR